MRLIRQFALALFVSATLLPAGQAAAQGNSAFGHSHNDKTPVSVPEPTTLALLGAAAGALGVRKIWRRRRSRQ